MKNVFSLLFMAIIIVGCGDDEGPAIETGNLSVEVTALGDVPVANALVYTRPETQEIMTNDSGVALFENIATGAYDVFVDLNDGATPRQTTAVITANRTVSLAVLIEPVGIDPDPVDVNFLLQVIYNELKNPGLFNASGYSQYWGDIGGDISYVSTTTGTGVDALDTYNITVGNNIVQNVWVEHYKLVQDANQGLEILKTLDPAANPEVNIPVVEAELKFLRALLYFNLVKLYGNPILITSSNVIDPIDRIQDPQKIYDLIIEDLIFAENNLEASRESNRASVPVAQALLGKVYLQMAGFPLQQNDKFALALTQLKKLDGLYSLEPNYADVFSLENEGNNSEVIFKIDFDASIMGNGGNYGVLWGPQGVSLDDNLFLAPGFAESYFQDPSSITSPVSFPLSVTDTRFSQNIAFFTVQNNQVVNSEEIDDWRPYKYTKDVAVPVTRDGESFDFPYLRYADVLLMIAEAENAINGPTQIAYDAINQVRRRAFGNMDNDIPAGLNQQEFLEAILQERRLELCYEGQRKDDLVRTQLLETVINEFNANNPQNLKDYQSHEYIWPIPLIEINANPNVVQNPGY